MSAAVAETCLVVKDGHPVARSTDVAEAFGRNHKNVLQAFERLEVPEEFNRLNYQPIEYTDGRGRKKPAIEMTRDGFVLLAMGFTGKQATAWKVKYIEAFNEMERELRGDGQALLPVATLTPAHQREVQNLIADRMESIAPMGSRYRPSVFSIVYGAIKDAFEVGSYSQIPDNRFADLMDFISRMEIAVPRALPSKVPMQFPSFSMDELQHNKIDAETRFDLGCQMEKFLNDLEKAGIECGGAKRLWSGTMEQLISYWTLINEASISMRYRSRDSTDLL